MASLADRTRKYFIIACLFTVLLLIGLSWKLLSTSNIFPIGHEVNAKKLTDDRVLVKNAQDSIIPGETGKLLANSNDSNLEKIHEIHEKTSTVKKVQDDINVDSDERSGPAGDDVPTHTNDKGLLTSHKSTFINESVFRRLQQLIRNVSQNHKGSSQFQEPNYSKYRTSYGKYNAMHNDVSEIQRKPHLQSGQNMLISQAKDEMSDKNTDADRVNHVQGVRPESCPRCFQVHFPAIIDHEDFCDKMSQKPIVLLLISSAPDNQDKRQMIRETWGSKCSKEGSYFRCLFVLGIARDNNQNNHINQENEKFNDILQFSFQDAYSNLTYKTLCSFLWVDSHCSAVPYIMKTDDDMYVNTELVPKMLAAAPKTEFIGGFCWGLSSPNRDASSKWYVSFQTYARSRLPPMCSGTGYILSQDVIEKIIQASSNIPFFHLEDVYVAMCLQKFNIRPIRIKGFNNMYVRFNACDYRNSVMTSHEIPYGMLREYWEKSQSCSPEDKSPQALFVEMPYPPTR